MKKVLVIGLTGQMGGTENYIFNLVKYIDLTKYTFDFLVVEDGHKTPYEKEINQLIGDGNNHFYYCPNMKKNYFVGRKWLKKFYTSHSYDLIYMNATTAARTAYCRYAIDRQKTPMILHSHRSDGKRLNHTLYKPYSFRHSFIKLACSQNAADWMYGKKCKDAIIIPNGIDTARFQYSADFRKQIREEYGYSDKDIVLGHVGRFSEEKNHKFLIELAQILDTKYKFLFIGEGPTKAEITEKIRSLGLETRITVLPVRKDVNRFYSAMDAFIMPSFNEGLPIVSVEAQCAGLTCLFSDTVSRETNISGKCLYLSLGDLDNWKKTINELSFERYDGVAAITECGFSMQDTAKKVETYFEKAINVSKKR